jgi:hypothetical protein
MFIVQIGKVADHSLEGKTLSDLSISARQRKRLKVLDDTGQQKEQSHARK